MTFIHPSSYVSPEAKLGDDVEVGPFSIIHSNVILGNRIKVGAYCELGIPTQLGDGTPLIIGDDSLIRSHSVFYESSSFGSGLTTGHRVTVREKTIAGAGFQIGTLSEIQGDCSVGDYVRFQSNVFVGKKTTIGNFVWILPYVVLTNDPTPPSNVLMGCVIEDYASIAAAERWPLSCQFDWPFSPEYAFKQVEPLLSSNTRSLRRPESVEGGDYPQRSIFPLDLSRGQWY